MFSVECVPLHNLEISPGERQNIFSIECVPLHNLEISPGERQNVFSIECVPLHNLEISPGERFTLRLTDRQGLGFSTWRAVCRLVQVLEGSCAGLRGQMLAGAVPHGGAVDQVLDLRKRTHFVEEHIL